ncbi:uncharacterized protein LOC134763697 [Penaeus indicus]|uniref:uncharacterized protein LOC134763697 n=1 Tax=Penaeus indicus TaxID=29960 RepID=UPI00300D2D48
MDISIIQTYAPTTKSSDEDIDRFYAQLDQAYSQCKSQDIIIVMGDFNAKAGNERVDNIVGPHGLGSRADCYSDHVPVMGRFRAKMRTLKKPTLREQLDISLLQKNNTIKEKYAVEVKNRFSALEDLNSIEDHWKGLEVSIMDAANEVLPRILERWSEYLIELFDDERNTERTIDLEMSGPPIMEDEVRNAVRKMKKGKAPGPDNITLEMILALDEYGINLLTSLLNKIYDTGMMPLDLLKSVFIALPKKPGATECENHRTISLISQVTKILLKIITNRVRNKIKPEITEGQCDYTKAFDKVRHDEIINILEQLHIDGKNHRIIKNIYWEQIAAMRVDNEIGECLIT